MPLNEQGQFAGDLAIEVTVKVTEANVYNTRIAASSASTMVPGSGDYTTEGTAVAIRTALGGLMHNTAKDVDDQLEKLYERSVSLRAEAAEQA